MAEDNRNFRKETKPLEMSDCHRLFRGFLILSKMQEFLEEGLRTSVQKKCKELIDEFNKGRETQDILCLYEYQDLDYNFPILKVSMIDNKENEALLYELLGRLSQENMLLDSSVRKSYDLMRETLFL